jgi:hypothetical protein
VSPQSPVVCAQPVSSVRIPHAWIQFGSPMGQEGIWALPGQRLSSATSWFASDVAANCRASFRFCNIRLIPPPSHTSNPVCALISNLCAFLFCRMRATCPVSATFLHLSTIAY